MVSFSCEACNDTVIKKKLDQHKQRCYDAYFTCIDCSITFSGTDYRGHTQCISEAEKYEKALYRGKPTKNARQEPKQEAKKEAKQEPKQEPADKPKKAEKVEKVKAAKKQKSKKEEKSPVDLSKYAGDSLGKVLKSLAKDTKTEKKDLLKKLQLKLENGKVVLTL